MKIATKNNVLLRYGFAWAIAALWAPSSVFAQVSVELPVGGWRSTTNEGNDFLQGVTYPASSVNVEGKQAPALIKGKIARAIAASQKSAKSERQPAKLVVNGAAMPLSVEEDGSFARPYAFGAGSNSIMLKSPNAGGTKAVQFYDAGKSGTPGMRVVLSWSTNNTDLDLHIITPSGLHCFYGNRVLPDGSALDVDVTTGFGPEIWANPAPPKGVYHVYVNYFGAGEIKDAVTVAEVAIITQEGSLSERRQVFRVPLRKPGELMLVKSFVY